MSKIDALFYTRKLTEILDELNQIYERARQTKEEYDFHQVVEPYANQTQEMANKWFLAIQTVIKQEHFYFQGERQIDQIVDNVCTLSVQAFQYTTSYNRFKSYLQSTRFLLRTIERQLENQQ